VRVEQGGQVIADSRRAVRILETSHPPVYYVPREDILPGVLSVNPRTSACEFKGIATYWDLTIGHQQEVAVAWSYEQPALGFEAIAGHVAFYPSRMEACYVDEERVVAQPGDFYGGWITSEVVGPFKGAPGTLGW
jgi:uncharacterized protein (DUF427 family)